MKTRRVILIVLLVAILLPITAFSFYSTIFAQPSGGDWTSFTLDNSDSRYQAASTVTSTNVATLKSAWIFSTTNAVTGTPIVSNGVVYFADWKGNVYAVNINTGKQIWVQNLGDPISDSVLVDPSTNLLFVGLGPEGNVPPELYALNTADGSIKWSHTFTFAADNLTENTIFASPTLYNGMIYIGVASNDLGETNASRIGELFAVDEATGNVAWHFLTTPPPSTSGGGGVWGTVVVDAALNAVLFATGNAYASTPGTTPQPYSYSIISLNASSGALNWYFEAYANRASGGDNDFGSTLNLFTITISGVTYQAAGIPEKGGNYFVVDRTNGHLLLKTVIGTGTVAVGGFINPSGNNPEVFIPANPDVVAFFPATDTYGWKVAAPTHMTGSVAIVPGVVFYSAGKNFYALATSNGKQLFHTTVAQGINGGISVAEGYVLVPFGGGTPVGGSSTTGGVEAFAPIPTITSTTSSMSSASSSGSSISTTASSSSTTGSNQLALDGFASSSCISTSESCTVTLTTFGTSDVVILAVGMASTSVTVTSVSASGLTFSDRHDATGNGQGIHEWFALTTLPLSAESITLSRSSGTVNWTVMALAVSGANIVSPFDSNATVPCSASGKSPNLGCTLSTSNSNDMILGLGDQGGGSMTWTFTSGFNQILSSPPGTPRVNGEFEIVSAAQTSLVESVTSTSSNGWVWIGDAIQSA